MALQETPRSISQVSRHSAKYRNPEGPSKYFAPLRRRKLVDENIDGVELQRLEPKETLCPLLWEGETLKEPIRKGLTRITKQFIEFLGVGLKIKDVVLLGSMAGYNWSDKSDIDVHVIVDQKEIDADEHQAIHPRQGTRRGVLRPRRE